MGNLTLQERVDELEVMVRNLVNVYAAMGEAVSKLKQPVVIEKIKYRNRAKPLVKRDAEGNVKKRVRRWYKKPVEGDGDGEGV